MKILYAIQGTGNGHISRAREVIPHLLNYGEVDLLVSGTQAEVDLPYLITYKKHGVGFTFGKNGGVNFIESIKQLRPINFVKDVATFPVSKYNLIINDFEPITAWACKIQQKTCIALSHQAAFLSHKTPRPIKRIAISEAILKHYAPATKNIGFHFKAYDSFIHTPIIRSDVRKFETSNQGHITVYLPAHADEILLRAFQCIKDVKWHVFSKHSKLAYQYKNVWVEPIESSQYLKSLAASDGLITAGGFESPAEALYLRKKLMVIPMLNQYEQICNAEALKEMGVTVVKKIDETFVGRVKSWFNFSYPIKVSYINQTDKIIAELIKENSYRTTNHQLAY